MEAPLRSRFLAVIAAIGVAGCSSAAPRPGAPNDPEARDDAAVPEIDAAGRPPEFPSGAGGGAGSTQNEGGGGSRNQPDAASEGGATGTDASPRDDAKGAVGDAAAPPGDAPPAAPGHSRVFLDTDLVIDPGDMGSLAMLHGLADRCDIEIIGVTAVTTVDGAAGTLDATNTYYGRPDIPIGVLKGAAFLNRSGYAGSIAKNYPNDFKSGSAGAPDATALFRKVIAAQPDASVSVVAIGPLRNLRSFVESGPDDASPLSGRDLIAKKVKLVSIMGGHFEDSNFHEWNIEQDVAAAKAVASKWPGVMVWGGFEAGIGFQPDYGIIAKRPKSPVTFALNNAGGDSGPRPGWDQTSVLYAARPKSPYWNLSSAGKVTVRDDASTVFEKQTGGQHFFIDSVEVNKTPDSELVGVTVGKYGKITALMDDLEANAGHVGACKVAGSPASKE